MLVVNFPLRRFLLNDNTRNTDAHFLLRNSRHAVNEFHNKGFVNFFLRFRLIQKSLRGIISYLLASIIILFPYIITLIIRERVLFA